MDQRHLVIDDKTVATAKRFQREEALLLECLIEVDGQRVFESLGYPSLFSYCVERLKLSESIAYAFIAVARKARVVPELKTAVEAGKLSVSKAKRIVSVVDTTNAQRWIETATVVKQKELERLVAKETAAPVPVPQARMRFVGGGMTELTLVITQEMREAIERLAEVRGENLVEALSHSVKGTLKREDPVEKAKRNHKPPRTGTSSKDEVARLSSRRARGRKAIPAQVVHEVTERDQGRCRATMPNGRRCENRRHLHLHHLIPKHRGGPDTAPNLITLCSSHHRMHHRRGVPIIAWPSPGLPGPRPAEVSGS